MAVGENYRRPFVYYKFEVLFSSVTEIRCVKFDVRFVKDCVEIRRSKSSNVLVVLFLLRFLFLFLRLLLLLLGIAFVTSAVAWHIDERLDDRGYRGPSTMHSIGKLLQVPLLIYELSKINVKRRKNMFVDPHKN